MIAGILIAQVINIGTYNIRPWGWRLSLGLASVPGTILLLGGLFLPDSPNSLIERGQFEKGKQVLQRIRGHPASRRGIRHNFGCPRGD